MGNNDISIKGYAHLGDAVYELYVRDKVVLTTSNSNKMHTLTTSFVRAEFQANLLENLLDFLTEDEKELVRRAKNIPLGVAKRSSQSIHRLATAFEVVIGFNYCNDKSRLDEILSFLNEYVVV